MADKTPMDELLKAPITDEVEDSPDNPQTEALPEKEEPKDTDKPAPKAKDEPQGEPEDEGGRRMHALPKWAHERLRANDEKTTAAERRAQEAERRAAEAEARLNGEGYQRQPDQQTTDINPELHKTRLYYSEKEAVRDFGAEEVAQAKAWGTDICDTDPQFNAALYQHPDPIRYVVQQFRRQQVARQLEEHNWDIDALVRSRAGQTQPALQPAAGASGASQPKPVLPSDFAGAPSGAQPTGQKWTGPTPLGDLIKPRR